MFNANDSSIVHAFRPLVQLFICLVTKDPLCNLGLEDIINLHMSVLRPVFWSLIWRECSYTRTLNFEFRGKSFLSVTRSCSRRFDPLPSPIEKMFHNRAMCLKRPSHGKLKLANSCWQTSKSWQTCPFTSNSSQITTHRNSQNGRLI